MATHSIHLETNQSYFITFTYHDWLNLFEVTRIYDYFEKWFNYLHSSDALLLAYVIMPNHFHGIVHLKSECKTSLNALVGNGKRFLAYEIVRRLKENGEVSILTKLSCAVNQTDKSNNKRHQVFRPSFDAKTCPSLKILEQKISYIHKNPVSGKWNLAKDWAGYPYSSADYYEFGAENKWVTDYNEVV